MTSQDVIAGLDVPMGGQVTFEPPHRYGARRKPRMLHVVKGDPKRAFELAPAELEGGEPIVHGGADCIRCEDGLFAMAGDFLYRCDADFTRRASRTCFRVFSSTLQSR